MTEAKIYVSLNDAFDFKQRFEIGKYKSILKNVCYNYHVPFSVSAVEGGYFHEDGTYTEENTLVITLIDIEEDRVMDIAKDLCAFFRQESVMVTKDEVAVCFIQEKFEPPQ